MKLSKQVQSMRELIATPSDWTVGKLAAIAPTGAAVGVSIDSPDARCFCLVGAAARTLRLDYYNDDLFGAVADSPLGMLLAHVIAGRKPALGDGDGSAYDCMDALRNGEGRGWRVAVAEVLYRFNDTAPTRNRNRAEGHAEILSVLDEAHQHAVAAGI